MKDREFMSLLEIHCAIIIGLQSSEEDREIALPESHDISWS